VTSHARAEPNSTIAIVGGGIAGLAAAHALHELGRSFLLLEASDRLGGVIRTERVAGFLVEGGPDSLLAQKPEGLALLRSLGLEDRLQPTNPRQRAVYVLHRGRLVPLPEGMTLTVPTHILPTLMSPLFSWAGKLRMGLDLVLPRRRAADDESIAAFVRRRFGREALERLAEPLLAGIHAGDPERLSLSATFPRLQVLEAKYGSLIRGLRASPPAQPSSIPSAFVSLKGGVGELVETLAAQLPASCVRLGSRVTSLRRSGAGSETGDPGFELSLDAQPSAAAGAVVLALPPHATAPLLRPLAEDAAAALGEIRFASTVVLVLGYRREDVAHPLDGYGLIVPRGEGLRTTALSFHSTKLEGRVPEGHVMLRVFFGGIHDGAVVELADEALLALAQREMGGVLGLRGAPVLARVYRWPRGTPQMEVGHARRVARVERGLADVPGLFVTGSGLRGTGLPDTIGDGRRAASAAAAFLAKSPA
jgi:oxygen-dependent protoporphyrinogen oxidase